MNVASFIARRIAFNRQKSFSRFIIRLATVATATSVAAMIISSAFVSGFQEAISQKVFSFWGHIRVVQNVPTQSYIPQDSVLPSNDAVLQLLQSNKNVQSAAPFVTQSAVIEHNKDIEGILIKGVNKSYPFQNIHSFLQQGNWINFSDSAYSKDISISQAVASELNIQLGDTVHVFFITSGNNRANMRSMRVSAIYKTGIDEYDKLFAIADMRLIQKVNDWDSSAISGYEVALHDYKTMDSVSNYFNHTIPADWLSMTIKDVYPNIFDWLNIQDVNKVVIYVIMSIVAVINLITCLLILVLERMKMTGVLKSIGGDNWLIQKIFLYHSSIIALRGVLYGFVIGIGLCLLQQHFGILKLDESAYYIRVAPIKIVWTEVAVICTATFVVCYAALILPTLFVRKIQPVRAIKFD